MKIILFGGSDSLSNSKQFENQLRFMVIGKESGKATSKNQTRHYRVGLRKRIDIRLDEGERAQYGLV